MDNATVNGVSLERLWEQLDTLLSRLPDELREEVRALLQRLQSARSAAESRADLSRSRGQLAQQAMALAGIGLWEWDDERGQLHFDPTWARLHGFEHAAREVPLELWSAQIAPDDRAALETHLDRDTGGHELALEYRLADDPSRWVRVMARRQIEGAAPLIVGLAWDITEERQQQRAVAKLQKELARLQAECDHLLRQLDEIAREQASTGESVTEELSRAVGKHHRPVNTLTEARILVADDNAVNRKVLRLMLEKLGHACLTVENGAEALEVARRDRPEVILMDLQMPEMDGAEATLAIRNSLPSTAQPYIVALTAAVTDQMRTRCEQAGMDAFLTKPVRPDVLQKALEQAFASKDDPRD